MCGVYAQEAGEHGGKFRAGDVLVWTEEGALIRYNTPGDAGGAHSADVVFRPVTCCVDEVGGDMDVHCPGDAADGDLELSLCAGGAACGEASGVVKGGDISGDVGVDHILRCEEILPVEDWMISELDCVTGGKGQGGHSGTG